MSHDGNKLGLVMSKQSLDSFDVFTCEVNSWSTVTLATSMSSAGGGGEGGGE